MKNTSIKMERAKKSDLKSHDKTDNMNVEPIANLLIAEGISTALLLKKAMGMSSVLASMPEHKKEQMELVDALKGILKM